MTHSCRLMLIYGTRNFLPMAAWRSFITTENHFKSLCDALSCAFAISICYICTNMYGFDMFCWHRRAMSKKAKWLTPTLMLWHPHHHHQNTKYYSPIRTNPQPCIYMCNAREKRPRRAFRISNLCSTHTLSPGGGGGTLKSTTHLEIYIFDKRWVKIHTLP